MAVSAHNLAKSFFDALHENPERQSRVVDIFLEFLEEKKLLALLPHIVRSLEKLQEVEKSKQTLKITLQQNHAKDVIEQIRKKINAPDSADTKVVIDDDIKGGFIAQYNNVVYDGSVATQLQQIKKRLLS